MAKVCIRNAALDLYMASGGSSISITGYLRPPGSAPGLVVHHYGSKEGLRRALDQL